MKKTIETFRTDKPKPLMSDFDIGAAILMEALLKNINKRLASLEAKE